MSIDQTNYIAVTFDNAYESEQFQQFLFRYGFGWGENAFISSISRTSKLVVSIKDKQILSDAMKYNTLSENQAYGASLLIKNRCSPAFNCDSFFKKLEN